MQNIEGSNWSPKVKSVYFLGILLFLALTPLLFINGCGGDTNSGATAGDASLPNLTLTFPDGYSVDRSTGRVVSKDASSALTAPAYVTGITLTITGENIETQVFDVPLDTGIVSGTLPPGEYTFSVAVTTNIGLTFTGSTNKRLVKGVNGGIVIQLTLNAPPVITSITISNSAPVVGDTVTANCSATDADGDAITYAWSGAASGAGQSISFTIPADGTFTFTCTASDGRGGVATASVSATAGTVTPPGVITWFQATPGDGQVQLVWDPFGTAPVGTSFNIYWSLTPGVTPTTGNKINIPDWTSCNVPAATCFYTHNGLSNRTPYYYIVTAVDTGGESAPSAEVSATPVDPLIAGLVFADPNLTACVNTTATTNNWLYVSQMTLLDCSAKGIINLTGIEQLTALTDLILVFNPIVDVTPLSTLPALRRLLLLYSLIVDVSPLSTLTTLTWLDLRNNQIVDLSPLSTLTALTNLMLQNNQVVIVSPLSSLTALTTLSLWNNQVIDVTPLSSLTALTTLSLWNNQVIDVTPLSSLTALTTLSLQNNQIGGQGVGNIDLLSPAPGASILLNGNIGQSCAELTTLIANPNGYVVDVTVIPAPAGPVAVATCTNP